MVRGMRRFVRCAMTWVQFVWSCECDSFRQMYAMVLVRFVWSDARSDECDSFVRDEMSALRLARCMNECFQLQAERSCRTEQTSLKREMTGKGTHKCKAGEQRERQLKMNVNVKSMTSTRLGEKKRRHVHFYLVSRCPHTAVL